MEKKTKIISLKNHRATNPSNETLTIEKLKTFKALENLSEEEAQQMLLEIKVLSAVMIDLLNNQQKENSENDLTLNEAA